MINSTKQPQHCIDCSSVISPQAMRCRSCSRSRENKIRWSGDDPRREKLRERNESARNGFMPYRDKERLKYRYEDMNMSLRQIACEARCGLRTIARWMEAHDIPTRDPREARLQTVRRGPDNPLWKGGPKPCPRCGRKKAFSSKQCWQCHVKNNRGENHPHWRGLSDVMKLVRTWSYEHWRPLVYDRDEHKCQTCGDAKGGNLNAHHIEPLSIIVARKRSVYKPDLTTATSRAQFAEFLIYDQEVTSLDNGITLCEACHRNTHGSMYIPQQKKPHGRKITLAQRDEIAALYAAGGITQRALAERYGLTQGYISVMVRRSGIRVGRGSRHSIRAL